MEPHRGLPGADSTGGRIAFVAIGGLLAALALPACGRDIAAPIEEPDEQLLFLSTRVGGTDELGRPLMDVYRMKADGTVIEDVTEQPAWAYFHLDLSPDGRRLLYVASPDCDFRVKDVDGGAPARLTNLDGSIHVRCNTWPRWSPDGSHIASASNREDRAIGNDRGLYDVWVMDADGSNAHNVSRSLGAGLGLDVVVLGWSPTGQVVFESSSHGVSNIMVCVVNVDGTGLHPLFNTPGDHSPAWSPDGSMVVFIREAAGGRRLYRMNADGSGERALTAANGSARLPGNHDGTMTNFARSPWSPDGRRIAFDWDADNQWGTWTINADGTGLKRLTDHPTRFNGWSPSGTRIAFTSRVWPSDVFVANADGTGLANLTASPFDDTDAIWLPAR